MISFTFPEPPVCTLTWPLTVSWKATSGLQRANSSRVSIILVASAEAVLKNFLRAGVLKNMSLTITVVPLGAPVLMNSMTLPPSREIREPISSSSFLVIISVWDTEAILAKASPLKPNVFKKNKSSLDTILLVA